MTLGILFNSRRRIIQGGFLKTSYRKFDLAATAMVWRTRFNWVAPTVTNVSAPLSKASPSKYSSCWVLCPPEVIPVQSSRFTSIGGPSNSRLGFGKYSRGVGNCDNGILGKSDISIKSVILDSGFPNSCCFYDGIS